MMSNSNSQLSYLESRQYRKHRRYLTTEEVQLIIPLFRDRNLSYTRRATERLKAFLWYETPAVLPDTRIQGLRTLIEFPDIYDDGEITEIRKTHYIHEAGKVMNLAWDVETVLREGLEGRRRRLVNTGDNEFVACVNETIDAVELFVDRYVLKLKQEDDVGKDEYDRLSQAIRFGASSLWEALQTFRFLHFVQWCSSCYHNTIGRFDQWAYSYYARDLEQGIETVETAYALIKDFFISFNWDSDLYEGMTMGDNGQSLVIGGILPDGRNGVNSLTWITLEVAKELKQIDPKINLRVNKDTPLELYIKATELTKLGLGFPQYANDDVVIPCLKYWGYSEEDARDYTIAACWEFIVPGNAMDIPNVDGIPVAEIVRDCIVKKLAECENIDELLDHVKTSLKEKARKMVEAVSSLYLEPSPFMSLLMMDCLEHGQDISHEAKYNNYGFHATGVSCGADQLATVDGLVFRNQRIDVKRLITGLETNFAGDPELRFVLRNEAEKMGRDDKANYFGNLLLGYCADVVEGLRNERGGRIRVGTGTAMYYVWHGERLPATADGRDAGAYLPANYSPSLFLTKSGPLSIMKGFASENLTRACNGGPLTMELHETLFKEESAIEKVAALVRAYLLQGGHQLQINAVSKEKMLAAQKEPEKYRDLIVRVWGWSGYFVELEPIYQEHVIARVEYDVKG